MAAFRCMVTIVALAAPQLVPARPAVARSFEAEARAAPPALPGPPLFLPPPPPGPVDLRPRVFVRDLDHLAALVSADPAVGPRAQALQDRRTRSSVVFGIGAAASLGALLAGAHQMTAHAPEPGDPDFGREPPGQGLVVGGLLGLAASAAIAALLHPTQGDLLDVLDAWNGAHPDRPLELVHVRHVDPVHR